MQCLERDQLLSEILARQLIFNGAMYAVVNLTRKQSQLEYKQFATLRKEHELRQAEIKGLMLALEIHARAHDC